MPGFEKLGEREQDRQTDTQTDGTENMTTLHSRAVNNGGPGSAWSLLLIELVLPSAGRQRARGLPTQCNDIRRARRQSLNGPADTTGKGGDEAQLSVESDRPAGLPNILDARPPGDSRHVISISLTVFLHLRTARRPFPVPSRRTVRCRCVRPSVCVSIHPSVRLTSRAAVSPCRSCALAFLAAKLAAYEAFDPLHQTPAGRQSV